MPKGYKLIIRNQADLIKELFARADRSGGPKSCWNWKLSCNKGYGQFNFNGMKLVHRLIWCAIHGRPPIGMCVCHKCDNRKCINPAHLFLGTQQDNLEDMLSKGRNAKGAMLPNTVLTPRQVRYIRKQYKRGRGSLLANQFGVNANTIYDVVKLRTWSYVK